MTPEEVLAALRAMAQRDILVQQVLGLQNTIKELLQEAEKAQKTAENEQKTPN